MTLHATDGSVWRSAHWNRPMRPSACLALLLFAANLGFAAEPPTPAEANAAATPAPEAVPDKPRVTPSVPELIDNQQQIRAEIESGKGKYRGMPSRERKDLYAHQDNLLGLLEGKQSFGELNENDKTEAFNELEWIKARLTQAEDDRLVCEVIRPSGSNLTKRVCKSVKQLRLESQNAREMLDTKGQCIIKEACSGRG